MRARWTLPLSVGLAWIGLLAADLQAALLTIEQAVDFSQRTGRPIFAVAGSAT
ncbi:MAG: hypothetical protein JXB62_06785 [Pirellulales bacterium]|nr:hypothetical protein [Pirellulales bacterium]